MKRRSSPLKNLVFGIALLGAIVLFFYQKEPANIDSQEKPVLQSEEPSQKPEAPLSITEKLNPYTYAINRMVPRAYSSHRRYTSWVDLEEGPTGKERHIYGLYKLYDLNPVQERVTKANEQSPRLPELEKAAEQYLEALNYLHSNITQAEKYYDQKNYLDDDMEQGKSLHLPLLVSFEAFFLAEKKLRARLKYFISESKNARSNESGHQALMDFSTEFLNKALDQPQFSLDHEKLSIDIQYLDEEWEKLRAEGTGRIPIYANVPARDFLKSAKELYRRVRDQKAFSRSENILLKGNGAWLVEGSQGRLINSYNKLVSAYNSVNPEELHYFKVIYQVKK